MILSFTRLKEILDMLLIIWISLLKRKLIWKWVYNMIILTNKKNNVKNLQPLKEKWLLKFINEYKICIK